MYKLIIIFVIVLPFLFSACTKKDSGMQNEEKMTTAESIKTNRVGVVNADRLRIRSDNDLHSKTLRYLDKGDIVKILNKDDERVRIDEMEDYWYEIEYNGITGWIFGYYLDLYTDYESAGSGSRRYTKTDTNDSGGIFYAENISYNLFYLENGKLYQVAKGVSDEPLLLKTAENQTVLNYFLTRKFKKIYYISSNTGNIDANCNLYSYDFNLRKNELIQKSVYTAYFDPDNYGILTASIRKKILEEYWIINILNLENSRIEKEVVSIKKGKVEEIKRDDHFSRTLRRELGSFCHLEWNDQKSLIYFKPPEENQTYLISTGDGSFIKIDEEKTNTFMIDPSRYLEMNTGFNAKGDSVYTIILKDKFSGLEKEILASESYPINFSLSPRLNYVAITFADIKSVSGGYHPTAIYLLSLNANSLLKLRSGYQPKWSYSSLK